MSAKQNLSNRLHDELGDMIAGLAPGDRLPTEPKLAQLLHVSRATLREAMRTFETQGLIQRRQGVGTFVVHPAEVMDTGLEVLESIESMARRVRLAVEMGDFQIETRDAESGEREILKTTRVHQVSRVMEAEGRPIAYLIDIVPVELLSELQLKQEFTGSVLDLFLKHASPSVSSADTEIHAAAVESDVARALRIQRGDVVLYFRSSLFSLEGLVIGITRSYFLPGYFRFHIIRRV